MVIIMIASDSRYVPKMIRTVFNGKDVAAELAREYLCNNFVYAANRVPEICDTIVAIDNAMKWGFGWEIGPFAKWDLLGVPQTVAKMKALIMSPTPLMNSFLVHWGNSARTSHQCRTMPSCERTKVTKTLML